MSHVVSTTTGYRNLQSYSHVYQPVTTVGTSTDSISYDPAQYRRIILLDMDETERDNLWIREEIRRVHACILQTVELIPLSFDVHL